MVSRARQLSTLFSPSTDNENGIPGAFDANVIKGTLTRSFISGETYDINLKSGAGPSPVVAVTKEVPQLGILSKGAWDVNTDGTNYTRHNTAYNTSLTPSNTSNNGIFTLGEGSFSNNDIGKQIEGNGGKAILTGTDGSYLLVTAFNDSNIISAGNWSMFATTFDSDNGLTLFSTPRPFDMAVHDIFEDGSSVATYFLEDNGNDEGGNYNINVSTSSYVAGKSGQGYQISSASEHLTYYGYPAHPSNEVTISCWVKSLGTTWEGASIVWTWSAGNGAHDGLQFAIDGGKLRTYDGASSEAAPNGTVPTQEWVHLIVSCKATSQDFYMNGVYKGSTSASYANDPISANSWDLVIGQEPDSYTPGVSFGGFSGAQDLGGIIDSIRIFNRAITAEEAVILAEQGVYDLSPSNQYHVSITNSGGQINSTYWVDINSMSTDQITGDGEIYYAVSTDNHITWKVIDNVQGERNIVRLNEGIWEYNSNTTYTSTTWSTSTINNELSALSEALSIPQNRMDKSQVEEVTDPNHYNLQNSLDLMIAIYKPSGKFLSGIPSSDGVSINYDAEILNKGAVVGSDYDYDLPSDTVVRLTSNESQNLKIKIL